MAAISQLFNGPFLSDTSGAPIGVLGRDGREYLFPPLVANATPATVYALNSTSVGVTTPAAGRFTTLGLGYTDSSGTPGNVTNNSANGKAAFAAAASTCVVTSSLVTAASVVHVQMEGADATLTSILRVVPAAGSFTVTGNAAATAATRFSFTVINS